MMFMKTAAVAAFVAVATLASGGAPAEAHGKKHWGKHGHFQHHHFKHKHHYGPRIVIASPRYSCGHWLHRYEMTGKKKFLRRYRACLL